MLRVYCTIRPYRGPREYELSFIIPYYGSVKYLPIKACALSARAVRKRMKKRRRKREEDEEERERNRVERIAVVTHVREAMREELELLYSLLFLS